MSVIESLKLAPFNLSDDDLAWVSSTLASLSTEDRLRQLIVQISIGDDPAAARGMMEAKLGGLCRMMGGDIEAASSTTRLALESASVPPFVTADLEGGGHLSPVFTRVQSPLGLAAQKYLQVWISPMMLLQLILDFYFGKQRGNTGHQLPVMIYEARLIPRPV